MSVKFYQFGKIVGGTSGGGTVIPQEAAYGPGETFSGTLGAAVAIITPSQDSKHVTILNTHDNVTLEYSLDGGVIWLGLMPYGQIQVPVAESSIQLRGNTCTYEVIFALQEP